MDQEVVLKNGVLEAHILYYGATLRKLLFMGGDVILGYDSEAEYRRCGGYLGATVGRYANRISNGRFTLGGREYVLACNESGRGHIHGGEVGSDKRIFRPNAVTDRSASFSLMFRDGEEGYPGNLDTTVTFSLDGGSLAITYAAVSDADTVYNPTNHAYFNLNGGGSILGHLLTVDADAITPVDEKLIPLREMMSVSGTPFDFRKPKEIGKDIRSSDSRLAVCGGYDHNYVLRGGVELFSPESGVKMRCETDMPGVQIYTGNFLHETGSAYRDNEGVCLETQFFPDSPNRPDFPSPSLRAGKPFRSETRYTFSTVG